MEEKILECFVRILALPLANGGFTAGFETEDEM